MKLIMPNKLELLSCSISESDAVDGALWSASTTYSAGQKVRYNHVIYESLLDGNRNNKPDGEWSGLDAKWKKVDATLPWKMLDDFVETQTVAPENETLQFCVPFKNGDAFALLNTQGIVAKVKITDLDADGSIKDISAHSLYEYNYEELQGNEILLKKDYILLADIFHHSLYEYNYFPFRNIENIAATGIASPANGTLCVEIESCEGHSAAVGHVIVGRAYELGLTKYGAEIGFTDYSRKETDEFGVTRLVRRSYAKRISPELYLHPNQKDYVVSLLHEARGLPCLWIGDNIDNGYQSLTTYGWLEDFRLVCEGPNEDVLSLEIQGLI